MDYNTYTEDPGTQRRYIEREAFALSEKQIIEIVAIFDRTDSSKITYSVRGCSLNLAEFPDEIIKIVYKRIWKK